MLAPRGHVVDPRRALVRHALASADGNGPLKVKAPGGGISRGLRAPAYQVRSLNRREFTTHTA